MKSRSVVGFLLLLTIAAGTASAQTALQGSIKGGINFATVSGHTGDDTSKSMRVGGAFGGGVSGMINDRVTLDVDVLYSMEGTKLTFTEETTSIEATAQVDYVRIPVLLRFGAGSGARASYVLVGPSIGILTRARSKIGAVTDDLKQDFKKADLGLVFGAGTTVNKLFVEGRYTLGLTNVNKSTVGFDAEELDANRNQVVTVLIGKRF